MDLTELTVSRRTVHSYKTDKIADEMVEKALALSLWAPNHKLTYPWAYFWTGPVVRGKLADLGVELKSAREQLSESKKTALRENVLNPSHLILMGLRVSDDKRLHEDYATLACSVQIATTFLWQHGIGTKWSTGGWSADAKTYGILGISPAEYRLEGALMIGVPLIVPASRERPPLTKFLNKTS